MLTNSQPRVLHVITGLGTGGAENMLYKLLQATQGRLASRVVALSDGGSNWTRIEELGVSVESLGITRGRLPGSDAVRRLRGVVREFAPDAIQGWMYHGNLAAWLAKGLAPGRPRLIWNIRQTLYDPSCEPSLTRWVIWLGARFSRAADIIVYNSMLSKQQHQAQGYAANTAAVIPNGFDLDAWVPNPTLRAQVRSEFGIPGDSILVGQVARYHPMKGHQRLLEAAAILAKDRPGLRWLLIGQGVTRETPELSKALRELGLEDRVVLAGERSDVARLMCALDILVSASEWGEGFPNVLGEALAAGVPCVTTDIGDSPDVVGDCGRIVAPGDAAALAAAVDELAILTSAERVELGVRGRERVRRLYSLEGVAARYLELYRMNNG